MDTADEIHYFCALIFTTEYDGETSPTNSVFPVGATYGEN